MFNIVVDADSLADAQACGVNVSKDGSPVESIAAVGWDWSIGTDGRYTANVAVTATDAGKYTVQLVAPGVDMENKSATFEITAVPFSSVNFELESAEYEQGDTPQVKSAKLGDVDVTDQVLELIENKDVTLYYEDAEGQRVADIAKAETGAYKAKLRVAKTLSGNFSGSEGNKTTAKEFNVVAPAGLTTSQQAFVDGKAIEGKDQDGKVVKADDKGKFSVVADGVHEVYVIPTSVMPKGGENAVEVELANEGGIEANIYSAANSASQVLNPDFTTANTYYVSVKASDTESVYAGEPCYVPLTIKAYAYEDVSVFDNSDGKDNTAKTSFTYSGETTKGFVEGLGWVVDGKVASIDDLGSSSDISDDVNLYDAAGAPVTVDDKTILEAGTYTITAKVADVDVKASFTVDKLDLSKAAVVTGDIALAGNYASAKAATMVNGKALPKDVDFSVAPAITAVGSYKATVSASSTSKSVTGSATTDFNVVTDLKAEAVASKCYLYDGKTALDDNNGSKWDVISYDLTGAGAFDAENIAVSFDNGATFLEGDEYTVTVFDENGSEVTGGFKANETYTMVVKVVPNEDYEVGGTFIRQFTCADGDMTNDVTEATVTYKGDVYGGTINVKYTGSDALSDIKVTLKDGKKTLAEGTDYELVLKQGSDVVDGAVEEGYYQLYARGLTYSNELKVADIHVGNMVVTKMQVKTGDKGVVAWTGNAIQPVIEYTLDSAAKIAAGTAEWFELSTDDYAVAFLDEDGKAVSEVVDEGDYTAVVTPSTKLENMTLPTGDDAKLKFTVSKTVAGFVDVSSSEWYADVIAKANGLEYMTGISGTAMFAPNATITRAEVAQVFANMAGVDKDDTKTYPTKFSDVEADAWYAQAISWASQAGVVGGYDGTDLFGSFDEATREQVATMIYRYAAVAGLDTSVEDEAAALASYKDASQLTFGKTAMAWCVENGIMGVDTDSLNPLANMSRAEMAATAVRVQPEKLA